MISSQNALCYCSYISKFYYQLMHKIIALKEILKFTLKQLQHVSVFIPIYEVYPTRCNVTHFTISRNCSTCFEWYLHPSSGAHTTSSTASGICHNVAATCRYCGRVPTLHMQPHHQINHTNVN
jgi:hypothetical protein